MSLKFYIDKTGRVLSGKHPVEVCYRLKAKSNRLSIVEFVDGEKGLKLFDGKVNKRRAVEVALDLDIEEVDPSILLNPISYCIAQIQLGTEENPQIGKRLPLVEYGGVKY